MNTSAKFWSVVVAGWIVPITCLALSGNLTSLAFAAVAIAWWHADVAAKLETKLQLEKTPAAPVFVPGTNSGVTAPGDR